MWSCYKITHSLKASNYKQAVLLEETEETRFPVRWAYLYFFNHFRVNINVVLINNVINHPQRHLFMRPKKQKDQIAHQNSVKSGRQESEKEKKEQRVELCSFLSIEKCHYDKSKQ